MISKTGLYQIIGPNLILHHSSQVSSINLNIVQPSIVVELPHIYIIGGKTSSNLNPSIFRIPFPPTSLNPVTDQVGSICFMRFFHTSNIHKSNIYTIGGSDSNSVTPICEKFNISSLESSLIDPLPFGLILHSAVVLGDKLYVVGGQVAQGKFNRRILFLDLKTDKWITGPETIISMNKPVLIGVSQHVLMIFGGWAKDCKFNGKVFLYQNGTPFTFKRMTGYSFPEYFESWKVEGKMLAILDHCGNVHYKNFEDIKRKGMFLVKYKKVWKRRKVFIFYQKFAKSNQINLPFHLIREIIKML